MEGITETRRVSGRIGFVIEFLALKVRRSKAAALDQVDKVDFRREEERGNERGRRSEEGPKPFRPAEGAAARAWTSGPGRNRPVRRVMAQRKADLAIFVCQDRRRLAACRSGRQD